jgi:hypothetical protein
MLKMLINPFRYIAGVRSLLIGLAIILATALLGHLSETNFPDVMSVKIGYTSTFLESLTNNLCDWIAISAILYVASLIFSKSRVRIVDILGTQALARAPYLIASCMGFFEASEKFGKYLLWENLKIGKPVTISAFEITLAIAVVVALLMLTIWLVVLMYNAFKESSNIKGNKSILIYTVSLLVAIVLSMLLSKGVTSLIS